MPPSESPYVDVPLNLGRKSIRLVTLEHGDVSGPIKCILQSHALDECPAYVALSYAWGAEQRYDNIYINGSSWPVGRNLWHFLHQMRMQRQHVSFWIDAISIDQANVFEQNHQVQMMREIYTQAYSVWIWLGEANRSASSDVAMQYLSKRTAWSGKDVDLKKFWNARQAKSVLELCERGYWKRIWIVQEVLLAKEIRVLCGGQCVEWTKIQQLGGDLQAISDRNRSLHVVGVPAVLESSAAIIIKAKAQWNGVARPFTLLLEQYHRQHSTDVRDKVYALHGLASDGGMIPINYRIDPKQLLAQMICHACSPIAPITGMKRSRTDLLSFARLMQKSLKVFYDREEILSRHIAVARWNSTAFCTFDSSKRNHSGWSRGPFGRNIFDRKAGQFRCDRRGCFGTFREPWQLHFHAWTHAALHCVVNLCHHRFDRKDQLWDHVWHFHRNVLQSPYRNVLQSPSLSRRMFYSPCHKVLMVNERNAMIHSQSSRPMANPYTMVHWDERWHSLRIVQLRRDDRYRRDALGDCSRTLNWECRLNECSCKYVTRQ